MIEATLRHGCDKSSTLVLIEATSNQVNQDGGYTGMVPSDFRKFVHAIADRVGCARDLIILGGDHLGPNAWASLIEWVRYSFTLKLTSTSERSHSRQPSPFASRQKF